ncbi:helix-turn-helix domain-containing protein [Sutcliffiella cohnii]
MTKRENLDGKILGELIYKWRKEQNITQRKVAEDTGIDEKTVSRLERGIQIPETMTLYKFCIEAKMDITQLFHDYQKEDEKQNQNEDE